MKITVKKIAMILGIDISDKEILVLVGEELVKIKNVVVFTEFVRTNHNILGTNYKTGYQKFIYLADQYKNKTHALDYKQFQGVVQFRNELWKKVCDLFDEINWEVQINPDRNAMGYRIEKLFNGKEMQVLNKIGDNNRLSGLVRFNKVGLEKEIKDIVLELSKEKKALSLGYQASKLQELVQCQ